MYAEEAFEAVECWRRDSGVESMPASLSLLSESRYDITCCGSGQIVSVPFETGLKIPTSYGHALALRAALFQAGSCLFWGVFITKGTGRDAQRQ